MGIFIHLNVSKQVTRAEWEKVYQESLALVRAFPLYEKQKRIFLGEEMYCAVPTEEREWFGRVGWHTIGDSVTYKSAESYFLPKELREEQEEQGPAMQEIIRQEAAAAEDVGQADQDIFMSIVPMYTDISWEDERCRDCFSLWGNKTQGENYHIYLLAVACMIEDRLGERAVVYGDITRGQCARAVRLANLYLETPVGLPARCECRRLYERVRHLPLSGTEPLQFFNGFYLGRRDGEFGQFIRSHFTGEEIRAYWRHRFHESEVGSYRFERTLHEYLTQGFSLEELFGCVCLTDFGGRSHYEEFVESCMKTEVYIEEKDCRDWLETDPDEERPYGIYTLLARFALAGARNRRVERFIPLSELRETFRKHMGEACDVDSVITRFLKKEAERKEELAQGDLSRLSASDRLKKCMEETRREFEKDREQYDITVHNALTRYKAGDRIQPSLQKELFDYYRFYQGLTQEKQFQELMEKDYRERGLFIIRRNESVLLLEEEWRRIFAQIRENREIFRRYYPMVRVRIQSDETEEMVRALVVNDELFEYCRVNCPCQESRIK